MQNRSRRSAVWWAEINPMEWSISFPQQNLCKALNWVTVMNQCQLGISLWLLLIGRKWQEKAFAIKTAWATSIFVSEDDLMKFVLQHERCESLFLLKLLFNCWMPAQGDTVMECNLEQQSCHGWGWKCSKQFKTWWYHHSLCQRNSWNSH